MLRSFHLNLTILFALVAGATLVFGRAGGEPSLVASFAAYETALERGDARRAAKYGERALRAADGYPLFDAAAIARLKLAVAEQQARIGNSQRASVLVAEAIAGFDPALHRDEIDRAVTKLMALETDLAERGLRGTLSSGANAKGS